MYKEFIIDDKAVPAVCNAALPYRFNMVFGGNFFDYIGAEMQGGQAIELAQKLLFLMAKAAEGADMSKLNFDIFLEWLAGFTTAGIIDAAPEIVSFAFGRKGEAAPKD